MSNADMIQSTLDGVLKDLGGVAAAMTEEARDGAIDWSQVKDLSEAIDKVHGVAVLWHPENAQPLGWDFEGDL